MNKTTIDLPTMYGDHHVIDVRRILNELEGVVEVYASSAFGVVHVTYDPKITNDLEIQMKLDDAGYLGEWTLPKESSVSTYNEGEEKAFFRHTDVFEKSKHVVGFAQRTPYTGRPLWPCPGMGILRTKMEDE